LDVNELKQLSAIMEECGLSYLSYQDDAHKIVLRKKSERGVAPSLPSPESIPDITSHPVDQKNVAVVPAPVVGTVYLNDSEGLPFVKAGSDVSEGDVLCRIEAMKMFSDIQSPCAGKIARILIAEGELAEYDMPLFHIERADD